MKTYKEYISEFRKHFSRASNNEPLRTIVRCLELVQKPNEGDTEFIARLDSFSKQLEETQEGTAWTEPNHTKLVPLCMLDRMFMMGHVIKNSIGSITEKLYKNLNKHIPLSQTDYMIKG